MSESRGDAREIDALTGLRAVLAWVVVAFHFLRGPLPDGCTITRAFVSSGYVAVDVFFVLSGYVLALRYSPASLRAPGGLRAFYVRRLARVAPLYYASLLIGFAASWPAVVKDPTTAVGRARLLLDLLLCGAWSHWSMFRYNWAAWSLSVEVVFYALFPLVLPVLARATRRQALVVVAGAWVAVLVTPTLYTALDPDRLGRPFALGDEVFWGWYLKFFPAQRLPELVAGVAAARLGPAPRLTAPVAALALVAMAASGAVPYAYAVTGAFLALLAALVVGLASHGSAWLGSRALVLLGHASYATYILHVPVFQLLARYDRALWTSPVHVLAYLGIMVIVSVGAHLAVEEPLRRRLIARLLRSRDARTTSLRAPA